MSSLQQLLDRRRADEPTEPKLCHGIQAQAYALTVITSAEEKWIFPWHHLTSAHLTRSAARDELKLTFTSHVVTLRGRNLGPLSDLVAAAQLASLRVAPSKHALATATDPFIDALHIAPTGDRD